MKRADNILFCYRYDDEAIEAAEIAELKAKLASHDARVLREAADAFVKEEGFNRAYVGADWLRRRADSLEKA